MCVTAAEAAVQQDSKQVQVDQQDLGYETCGRSENEAEREDASSPGASEQEDLKRRDISENSVFNSSYISMVAMTNRRGV